MADKSIGDLPQLSQLQDESLLVVEQNGVANKLPGAMFKQFARDAASRYIDEGDFVSKSYVDNKSATAESNANAYTDRQIAEIPAPESDSFVVTVTSETNDSGKTTYSADKTKEEIWEAVKSGKSVFAEYLPIGQTLSHKLPLVRVSSQIGNPSNLAAATFYFACAHDNAIFTLQLGYGNPGAISYSTSSLLKLSGGTMTGAIKLSGDPTNKLHAAPKQYVDSVAASTLEAANAAIEAAIGTAIGGSY